MLNRLQDLQKNEGIKENVKLTESKPAIKDKNEEQMNLFIDQNRTNILDSLNKLNENIQKMDELKRNLYETILIEEQNNIFNSIDKLQTEVQLEFQNMKEYIKSTQDKLTNIDKLKLKNTFVFKEILKNLIVSNGKLFNEKLLLYNNICISIKKNQETNIITLAQELDENIQSRTMIEHLLANPNPLQLLETKLSKENAQKHLNELRIKKEKVESIESKLKKLMQLFQDVSFIVDSTQDVIDTVGQNIERTKEFALNADQELTIALEYNYKIRRIKFYILTVAVVILCLILYSIFK